MSAKRKLGQTLTEVLLAAIFLATGGLVIYSSVARSMQTEAWKANRVFAQGALHDMVEVYSVFSYCELSQTLTHKVGITDTEDSVIEAAFADDDFQKKMEEETSPVTAFTYKSFFETGDQQKPVVKSRAAMEADPIYKAYLDTRAHIGLKRALVLKDEHDVRAIVTCAVRFQSETGQIVTMKMPFVVFKRDLGPCI